MKSLMGLAWIGLAVLGCEYGKSEAVGPSTVSAPLTSAPRQVAAESSEPDVRWHEAPIAQVEFVQGWARYMAERNTTKTAELRRAAREVAQEAKARVAESRYAVKASAKKASQAVRKAVATAGKAVKSARDTAKEAVRPVARPAGPTAAPAPQVQPLMQNDWFATVTDKYLTEDIREALSKDPGLSAVAPGIELHTEYGAVTLTGYVPSGMAREALVKKITAQPGVTAVFDRLVIR